MRLLVGRGEPMVMGDVGTASHRLGVDWLVGRVGPVAGRRPGAPLVILTSLPAVQEVGVVPAAVVHLAREGPPRAFVVGVDGARRPAVFRVVAPGLPETGSSADNLIREDTDRRSRTVGALGEGPWRRMRDLRYALVGCGRTGSLVAHTLVRSGALRLALIDPDRVEPHNLDGDGFTLHHLRHPKAAALAESLRAVDPEVEAEALATSVTDVEALSALKGADVLICAADDDGARWACGAASTFYLKLLLDVGTGVLRGDGEGRLLGADIRWIVPGERCLLCTGGLARPEEAGVALEGTVRERGWREGRDWRRERLGSLRSLNQAAVGLALRMLEDYLSGHLRGSLWVRLTYRGGVPELVQPTPAPPGRGCLCRFVGGGDRLLTGISHLSWPLPR